MKKSDLLDSTDDVKYLLHHASLAVMRSLNDGAKKYPVGHWLRVNADENLRHLSDHAARVREGLLANKDITEDLDHLICRAVIMRARKALGLDGGNV